ncbi:MAG: dicarboxylate/amino acid:cation symporter [Aquificae bacterium]|nr:dicarboxylate/amino acid:cation symporter [Aquificota bacterium]
MWKRLISIENLTVIGIILGVLTGYYFPEIALGIKFLGEAFLNILKAVAIPLIFVSVFVSISALSSIYELKDMGIKTIVYYFSTTALAVLTGIITVNLIGFGGEIPRSGLGENVTSHEFSLRSFFESLIPENIFMSFAQGKVLQIIIFSILLAVATLYLERRKKEVLVLFMDGFNDVLIRIARWIILLTPIGVFSLVAYVIADRGLGTIFSLWHYVVVVVFGLLIHAVFNLGLIAFIFGKVNPFKYFLKVREAILVAFSTSSSSATLPVSLEVAQDKVKIKKKVAGFVLPLGATINMDGTALYESVAAMFIAHMYGIELSLGEQIIIFLTATLAAVGAAGIPSAGLVTMTLVLSAVGLPLEGVAVILAVDRFLDMLRTSINVWGDLIGAKIIDRFTK